MAHTKLIIIGGVAGGATAAARARRIDEHAEIVLFERGEYISFANCGLPYYIGHVIKKRDDLLLTTPAAFKGRYNIDVRTMSDVIAIDPANKAVQVKEYRSGRVYTESYDKLILSPGAEPVRPRIEGMNGDRIFSLRSVPDSDRIRAHVDEVRPQRAVIIGAGFIGIEMAENLAERGVAVTIIEMLDQIMPPLDYEMASLVQAHMMQKGVTLTLGEGVETVSRKRDRISVTTRGNRTECDMVILSVGIAPENRLAREAGLALSGDGHILVDLSMKTSDPDIYAVGDAVTVQDLITGKPASTALAGPANKQARIAADNALGRKAEFKGTLGTSVVKVFDMTAASTGLNEKKLKALGMPYLKSYTHSVSHATYYPGAELMSVKLLFAPGDGRILGCQIIGREGVDKRIDVMATAIKASLSVYDLEELELAYAPPYSSAKDPVNMAGFVAANILKGDMEVIHWDELDSLDMNDHTLIDLRNPDELEASARIAGAVNIPVNSLRARLQELDRGKTQVLFCAVGMRGYVAHRILAQHGFRSKNLSGGFRTYSSVKDRMGV
jgi:NADPH-dependent 2,4-dienoyl-CoA reductase/sulfur reductase-like enzyme/rhodanese-related sulfurtransferase